MFSLKVATGFVLLGSGISAFAITVPNSSNIKKAPEAVVDKSICEAVRGERVKVRFIRPLVYFRVPPSPEQIDQEGSKLYFPVQDAAWKSFVSNVCDIQRGKGRQTAPMNARIIVYLDGKIENAITIEYPDNLAGKGKRVRAQSNGLNFEIDSNVVRILLDYGYEEVN